MPKRDRHRWVLQFSGQFAQFSQGLVRVIASKVWPSSVLPVFRDRQRIQLMTMWVSQEWQSGQRLRRLRQEVMAVLKR